MSGDEFRNALLDLCDAAVDSVETSMPLVEGLHTTKEDWRQRVRQAAAQIWQSFDDMRDPPAACPRIVLAIPTYKRNFQIIKTLPINIVLSWRCQRQFQWVLTDLNDPGSPEAEEIDLLYNKCRSAVFLVFEVVQARRD